MDIPVLLIHGFGSSFDHGWRRTGWVDQLTAQERQVMAYDLPGHGTRASTSLADDFVDIGGKLLANLNGPVDVIGFSAGARVALSMACLAPFAINRLILIGAGDAFMQPYSGDELANAILADQPLKGHRFGTFHRLARSNGNCVEGMVAFLRRPDEPFTAEQLATFAIPTLLITGGRDSIARGSALPSALTNGTHIEIPACDHFSLPLAQETKAAALAFLRDRDRTPFGQTL